MKVPKPAKEIVPGIIVAMIGFIVLCSCFAYLKHCDKVFTDLTGIIRVIVALAAAAVSIALPDTVSIETLKATQKTDTIWPKIKAGGALAIFVIVYLFNPLN